MNKKTSEKYIQSQIRYWLSKLAMKNTADCVIATYTTSDDSLNASVFVNNQIVKEFDITKKPLDTTPKKCTFEYYDNYDNHVAHFDSINEAAKFFGYSRQAVSKFAHTGKEFETFKPFHCKVRFLYWGD